MVEKVKENEKTGIKKLMEFEFSERYKSIATTPITQSQVLDIINNIITAMTTEKEFIVNLIKRESRPQRQYVHKEKGLLQKFKRDDFDLQHNSEFVQNLDKLVIDYMGNMFKYIDTTIQEYNKTLHLKPQEQRALYEEMAFKFFVAELEGLEQLASNYNQSVINTTKKLNFKGKVEFIDENFLSTKYLLKFIFQHQIDNVAREKNQATLDNYYKGLDEAISSFSKANETYKIPEVVSTNMDITYFESELTKLQSDLEKLNMVYEHSPVLYKDLNTILHQNDKKENEYKVSKEWLAQNATEDNNALLEQGIEQLEQFKEELYYHSQIVFEYEDYEKLKSDFAIKIKSYGLQIEEYRKVISKWEEKKDEIIKQYEQEISALDEEKNPIKKVNQLNILQGKARSIDKLAGKDQYTDQLLKKQEQLAQEVKDYFQDKAEAFARLNQQFRAEVKESDRQKRYGNRKELLNEMRKLNQEIDEEINSIKDSNLQRDIQEVVKELKIPEINEALMTRLSFAQKVMRPQWLSITRNFLNKCYDKSGNDKNEFKKKVLEEVERKFKKVTGINIEPAMLHDLEEPIEKFWNIRSDKKLTAGESQSAETLIVDKAEKGIVSFFKDIPQKVKAFFEELKVANELRTDLRKSEKYLKDKAKSSQNQIGK